MTLERTYLSDEAVLNGVSASANDGRAAPGDTSQNTLGASPSQTSPAASGSHAPRDGSRAAGAAGGNLREALLAANLGPNFERLEDARPDLVNALRELEVQYRQEGIVARRHEIRRIRQARLFWQGLQYAWWNPQDMTWHLPFESNIYDDKALAEMPRYQFVTNLYQAFGLTFVSVLSQDVPATRFYPQSAQSIADITTAKAASQVCELVEQNNRVEQLLTGVAFYLWTDGKIGGYVRFVADGQRFGFHNEPVIEAHYVPLGEDAYVCPECGCDQAVGAEAGGKEARGTRQDPPSPKDGYGGQGRKAAGGREAGKNDPAAARLFRGGDLMPAGQENPGSEDPGYRNSTSVTSGVIPSPGAAGINSARNLSAGVADALNQQSESSSSRLGGTSWDGNAQEGAAAPGMPPSEFLPPLICRNCGAPLGPENFKAAERVAIPLVTGVRRVANGQEVISVVGGLELNTPVWANEMHEYPYLQ